MDDSQDIIKRKFSLQEFVADAQARRVNPVPAYFTRVATERLREVAQTRSKDDAYLRFIPLRMGGVRVEVCYPPTPGASPVTGSAEFGSIHEAVKQINQRFFAKPSTTTEHMNSLLAAPPKKPTEISYTAVMGELYEAVAINTLLRAQCQTFKGALKTVLSDALLKRWREKKGEGSVPDYSLIVSVEPSPQISESGHIAVTAQIDWFRLDAEFKNWALQRLEPLASKKIIEGRMQKYTIEAPSLEALARMIDQPFQTRLGECWESKGRA